MCKIASEERQIGGVALRNHPTLSRVEATRRRLCRRRVMLNGTIIFIALILRRRLWPPGLAVGAIGGLRTKSGTEEAKKPPTFRLEINSDAVWWLPLLPLIYWKQATRK